MKNWQFKNALQSFFSDLRKGKNIPWKTGKFWLISVSSILFITAIYFIFTYEGSIKKTTKTPIPQELKVLRSSFDKVKQISDPLLREYTIQKEAQRLKIQVINYRQLFDTYRKNKDFFTEEFLPDYPDNRLSIPGWFQWFFIEVSPPERLELLTNKFWFLVEKGTFFAALFALVRYLLEAPQRKKQELYQAVQVLYSILGKPSQDIKINALESLNKDNLSLRGLIAPVENLSGIDLKNAQIQKANLSDANLRDANFSNANLSDSILMRATLTNAILKEVNLMSANLKGVDLDDANLIKANLKNADLSGANLRNANLQNADLSGVDLSNADLNSTKLSGADLSNAKLVGTKLILTDLSGADLSGADLSLANLHSVIIDKQTKLDAKWRLVWEIINQKITNRNLKDADLSSADLSNTNLSGADMSLANLSGADLSGADMSLANLSGADLSGADMSLANLHSVIIDKQTKLDAKWHLVWEIINQKITNRNLSGVNLCFADLSGVNLCFADLSGADLSGADLSGANLNRANLRRVNIDEQTKLDAKWRLVWEIINQGINNRNLKCIDLSSADISRAELSDANLSGTDLSGTDLSFAYLINAHLNDVNLSDADLNHANLYNANLRGVNLKNAKLKNTNLSDADVKNALFGNNEGISEETKQGLIKRGAIFKDSPGDLPPDQANLI